MIKIGPFAETIMHQKYSQTKQDGTKETWEEIAQRVSRKVLKCISPKKSLVDSVEKMIAERKFMPGGRYLYAAGRPFHQVQNCLLLKAEDSREGWADLMQKSTMALMTGAGIGVVYSDVRGEGKQIRKTGGTSTGPLALMQMLNEAGRGIMQGGSRRSAIWAGLHWNHPDVHKFIQIKNWSPEVVAMKEKDYNFPAKMDGTNISVILDDDFFEAYNNEKDPQYSLAQGVYWAVVNQMLKTAEPGFSVDTGSNRKENLRNAPLGGETEVRTKDGLKKIIDIVGQDVTVWTGIRWAETQFKKTKENTPVLAVKLSNGRTIVSDPEHEFFAFVDGAVAKSRADELRPGTKLLKLLRSAPLWVEVELADVFVSSVEDAGKADVFCCDVKLDEHSFEAEGVIVSNCTEVTSEDDSDICNLGSINMAEIKSLEEMKEVVELATTFLLAGTIYSDVPYQKVDQIRRKNRRLGLGLMGLHEWLLKNGKAYGPDKDLEEYLKIYATSTEIAKRIAKELEISAPVKTRAIAPTGTIGIIAETTTGIEPIFCVAYKRRYLKGNVVNFQYVIDPCAQRLIDSGVSPDKIEDAYVLAENVERRVEFQHWLQKYVDHSISSTVNLPAWGSELNNDNKVREFGNMLMKYLPGLRGITCYPDGARGGQPLTPVKYSTAIKHVGEIFSEQADVCDITKGGSCGS